MDGNNQPQYSKLGSLLNIEKVSTFERTSPWKNAEVAFTWTNFDYPFFHTHEYWELMIMIEGRLNHFIDGKKYVLNVGGAWIVKPTDEHKLCALPSTPIKQLNFVIRKEYMQKLCALYGIDLATRPENTLPEKLAFTLKETTMRRIANETILIQAQKNVPEEEKVMSCKILLGEVFSEYIRQNVLVEKPYPDWLETLLIKLSDPFFEEGSIKTELVKNANYSYSSLIRLFKQYTGYTIIEYVQIKKTEYAAELIRSTDKKILEIAGILGYDSLSHFNHLFKRYTGLTPKEYRARYSEI